MTAADARCRIDEHHKGQSIPYRRRGKPCIKGDAQGREGDEQSRADTIRPQNM